MCNCACIALGLYGLQRLSSASVIGVGLVNLLSTAWTLTETVIPGRTCGSPSLLMSASMMYASLIGCFQAAAVGIMLLED
jgi:hypothetical protein